MNESKKKEKHLSCLPTFIMKDKKPVMCSCTSKPLKCKANSTCLEIKAVEQLRDECEGREEDLQGIDICSVSVTQLNSGLQQRDKMSR